MNFNKVKRKTKSDMREFIREQEKSETDDYRMRSTNYNNFELLNLNFRSNYEVEKDIKRDYHDDKNNIYMQQIFKNEPSNHESNSEAGIELNNNNINILESKVKITRISPKESPNLYKKVKKISNDNELTFTKLLNKNEGFANSNYINLSNQNSNSIYNLNSEIQFRTGREDHKTKVMG